MAAGSDNTRADDMDWWQRTGHCGRCGNPGDYCTCTPASPCGCSSEHPVGSARAPDALTAFTDTHVTADQAELVFE